MPTLTDSFRDLLPEGWKVVEDTEGEPIRISELELVSFIRPEDNLEDGYGWYIPGEGMRERAKEMGANHGLGQAQRFLEEEEQIPQEWRPFCPTFPGAIVQPPDGALHIMYFGWDGARWRPCFHPLEGDWGSINCLLRRKQPRGGELQQ